MNNEVIKLAVCITCHNRKEKTVDCLNSLYNQTILSSPFYQLEVYLCDDGSTDGTGNIVRELFPNVNIIQGDGELFWARGMEMAFSEAKKIHPDFFLMVNDDVTFYNNMLEVMLNTYNNAFEKSGLISVVGSIQDPKTKEWTYGGKLWNKKRYKDIKSIVYPEKEFANCDLANWNCFLLPFKLAKKVGNIESKYSHAMADYDYSIRILKAKGKIVVASDYVGTCSRNETKGTWQDLTLPLLKRYKLLHKVTARPIKSYIHYCKVAYGKRWLYWFCLQYIWIAKTSMIYSIKEFKNAGK